MVRTSIGGLPPRYSYMLNPRSEVRLSKCPQCRQLTYLRKFALFIHIDGWGPLALGKTCRYCPRCELIMVHQDELEAQLAQHASQTAPEVTGKAYIVLGTIEKKVWQAGLSGPGQPLAAILQHVAEFKQEYALEYEPGGWYPADQGPRKRK